MGVIETKVYECDGCGRKSKHSDFNTGVECGYAKIVINGARGGISYGGDYGGSTYNTELLFCFECGGNLHKFLKDMKKAPEVKK